jgi:hypothetical protein
MFESYTRVLAAPLGAVVAVAAGAVVGAATVGAVVGAATVLAGAVVAALVGTAVGTAVAAGAQAANTMANRITIENQGMRFVRSMVLLLRRIELAYAGCFADTMVRVLLERLLRNAEAINGVC